MNADASPGLKAVDGVPIDEANEPSSSSVTFDKPGLQLEGGQVLSPYTIAYQAYGNLNADKSNAILICHALTGDQHCANVHPKTGKPGWWDSSKPSPG